MAEKKLQYCKFVTQNFLPKSKDYEKTAPIFPVKKVSEPGDHNRVKESNWIAWHA